jgi:integrase/recombinase XerD
MATAPAATLVMYGKVPDLGWRRGLPLYAKNGLPKPGVMSVGGREVSATNLAFQIRTYENRQAVYVTVGSDYKKATSLLQRVRETREYEALQSSLGIDIPKTPEQLAADEAERIAEIERSRKTLKQYADEFLSTKKGLSRHSNALYRVIPEFIKFSGRKYLEDVTGQDVNDWYTSLKDAGYATRTCQTRYQTLRGFLMACGVNLTVLIDSATHRRLRKKPDQKTEPYTDEQVNRLLAACTDYYRVVFTLLLSTGLRMQEAMNLTWQQIRWDDNQIFIKGEQEIHLRDKQRVIRFKTKTGKGRTVPMFHSLKVALLEWREQHPNTTFVVGTKSDLPNTHWLEYLKDFARAANLNCGVCKSCSDRSECEEFYLHRFRHTFAARCLRAGCTLHQVSKWLGHSSVAVTAIYLSGSPDDAAGDPFAPKPSAPATNAKVVAINAVA